jgi:hypothetical protein
LFIGLFVIIKSWDWVGDIHRCVIGGERLDNFRNRVLLVRTTTIGDSVWWDNREFWGGHGWDNECKIAGGTFRH